MSVKFRLIPADGEFAGMAPLSFRLGRILSMRDVGTAAPLYEDRIALQEPLATAVEVGWVAAVSEDGCFVATTLLSSFWDARRIL